MTTRIIHLSAIAWFVAAGSIAAGCSDDAPTTPTTGGGDPTGGNGGMAVDDDDGGGGTGATGGGGMGGMGGDGGMGGMGGDPGCSSWSECCVDGCQKLESSCGQTNLCGNLGINCGATPPAEPLACIVECVAAETTSCNDFNRWLDPNDAPMAPNVFAKCVAACPGDFSAASPVQGIVECSGEFCGAEATACIDEQACSDWFAACAAQCSTPACWQTCTQQNPSQAATALNACLCGVQTNQLNDGDPRPDWIGTAKCSDILSGRMDACGL